MFKKFIQWQNYTHYILLGIGLFIWIRAMEFVLNKLPFIGITFNIMYVIGLIIGLFVLDSVIHLIFFMLPRPLKWEG